MDMDPTGLACLIRRDLFCFNQKIMSPLSLLGPACGYWTRFSV